MRTYRFNLICQKSSTSQMGDEGRYGEVTSEERRRPAKFVYVAEKWKPSSKLPAGWLGACTIYRANVVTLLGGQC